MIRRVKNTPILRELEALWRWLEGGPGARSLDTHTLDNLRLTAMGGLVLIVLLAFVYGTGALFGDLRDVHFFVGFALIPPLALKLGSTGWRFALYYLRSARYRAAGPPAIFPRLLAPFLVCATVLAVASGIVLWAEGTQRGPWSTVHTDTVIVLLLLLGLHLGVYVRRAVVTVRGDRAAHAFRWRWGAAALAVALGLGLARSMAFIEPVWHDRQREHHGHSSMSTQRVPRSSVPLSLHQMSSSAPLRSVQGH
jgi:hypothetical protein